MKTVIQQIHRLFPGKAFRKLILSVIALFLVSILDMLGVAVILPILQLATGAEITGYLDTINRLFGSPEDDPPSLSSVWFWSYPLSSRVLSH